MGTPGARLQGPFVSGSALALASWLPAPVATAPASMTPRSSNARRCSRPLPATGSGGEDAKSCVRFLRMLMVLSLDRRIISQKPNAIPALLRARRERPGDRRRAAECGQQLPPSDGDCHAPLPCEVRKRNDTTPSPCSLHVRGGQDAGIRAAPLLTRTNSCRSVPMINFHAAHEIHLVAVGSASRRLGSISSPQWAQMP